MEDSTLSDSVTTPANDDPKAVPANRGLTIIVIVLGVLIVLAFGALAIGFVTRMGGRHETPSGDGPARYMLPMGSKILQVQVTTTNRIIMAVQTPGGNEVDIFDTDTGRLIGQIKPAAGR
jgi:hypothetical protein